MKKKFVRNHKIYINKIALKYCKKNLQTRKNCKLIILYKLSYTKWEYKSLKNKFGKWKKNVIKIQLSNGKVHVLKVLLICKITHKF